MSDDALLVLYLDKLKKKPSKKGSNSLKPVLQTVMQKCMLLHQNYPIALRFVSGLSMGFPTNRKLPLGQAPGLPFMQDDGNWRITVRLGFHVNTSRIVNSVH